MERFLYSLRSRVSRVAQGWAVSDTDLIAGCGDGVRGAEKRMAALRMIMRKRRRELGSEWRLAAVAVLRHARVVRPSGAYRDLDPTRRGPERQKIEA